MSESGLALEGRHETQKTHGAGQGPLMGWSALREVELALPADLPAGSPDPGAAAEGGFWSEFFDGNRDTYPPYRRVRDEIYGECGVEPPVGPGWPW
jgi:hypothetical protein